MDTWFWGAGYGYQWWVNFFEVMNDRIRETDPSFVAPGEYCAWGSGGQYICVIDELDAVITVTTDDGTVNGYYFLYELFYKLVSGDYDTPMTC